ncbi:MAG: hypothetical protein M0P12_01635 [Paludibacteraceae bacterium]|nr:hypothetical protein [Paludibacteraceae bacterium]
MIDWRCFLYQAEFFQKEDPSVEIIVNAKNRFSQSFRLSEFLPLISEYQRLVYACKEYGFDVDENLKKAINQSLLRIRETFFVSTLGKKLSSRYPDVYIRIEWSESNEYFVNFYGFEGDKEEVTVLVDSIQKELDKDKDFFLLTFIRSIEETKEYYPNYVGKTGFDVIGV